MEYMVASKQFNTSRTKKIPNQFQGFCNAKILKYENEKSCKTYYNYMYRQVSNIRRT